MSFSESLIQPTQHTAQQVLPSAQQRYLDREVVNEVEALKIACLDHLTTDIVGATDTAPVSDRLTGSYKQNAEQEARDCLQIAMYTDRIYGRRIRQWTNSALKAYDAVLLYYIQDVRGERVAASNSVGQERSVYIHLESIDHNLAKVGKALNKVYQKRNEFTHVQYVEADGRIKLRPMSNKKFDKSKYIILEELRKALMALLTAWKPASA